MAFLDAIVIGATALFGMAIVVLVLVYVVEHFLRGRR